MRGFLIVAYSLWFSLGGLFANIVLKVRNDQAPLDWRTTIFTQFAMIGISYIVYWFMPESPQWAIRHGKVDLARRVLSRTYKGVDKFDVDKEINIMLYTVEVQKHHDADANLLGAVGDLQGAQRKAISHRSLAQDPSTVCRTRNLLDQCRLLLPDRG
jgi:SP family general alpha glucoside:H+ symporter-like MFS transporter